MLIELASRKSKNSKAFTNALEFLDQVVEVAGVLAQQRKDLLGKTSMSATQTKDDISCIAREQTEKTKSSSENNTLVEQLNNDINLKEYQIVNDMNIELSDMEEIKKKATGMKSRLEGVRKSGNDIDVFIVVNLIKESLVDMEAAVLSYAKRNAGWIFKSKAVSAENQPYNEVTFEVVGVDSKTKFVSKWKKYSQGPVLQKKEPSPYKKKCDFAKATKEHMMIIGMAADSGRIYALNGKYGKPGYMYVFDGPDKFLYNIELPTEPWDIAVLPGRNLAYITFSKEDVLLIVDLNSQLVVQKLEFGDIKSGGIAVTHKCVFIGTKGSIYVLNHEGEQTGRIELKDKEKKPWYMAINKDDIVYTDKRMLHSVTTEGKVNFTHKFNTKLNHCPWNVAVDNNGLIYVTVRGSGVHRFSREGSFLSEVIPLYITADPVSLCFNESCDELYIAYKNGADLTAFKRLDVFR